MRKDLKITADSLLFDFKLSRIGPDLVGLGKGKSAYVQCLDPYEYTVGGTVIFEIDKI